MSKGAIVGVIVAAVLVIGGLGYMWMNSKPQPPPGYKPIMPPGGYGSTASGMAARQGGGYPGHSGAPSSPPGPAQPAAPGPGSNSPAGGAGTGAAPGK
jgi:hypothetical protein